LAGPDGWRLHLDRVGEWPISLRFRASNRTDGLNLQRGDGGRLRDRGIANPDCINNAEPDSVTDADSVTNPQSDSVTNANADSVTNANADYDTNADSDYDPDATCYSYSDRNAVPYAYLNANADSDFDKSSFANASTQRFSAIERRRRL
jgi:hypothetical protein